MITRGLPMYEGGTQSDAHANYPTLILAALYLLICDAWGDGAHVTTKRRRIETVDEGITLQEIQIPFKGKSLYDTTSKIFRRRRTFTIIRFTSAPAVLRD